MNSQSMWGMRYPIGCTFAVIFLSLLVVLGVPKLLPEESAIASATKISARLLISGLLVFALIKLRWATDAGITRRPWRPHWWLAMLPMLLLLPINLSSIDWSALVFTPSATIAWLGFNVSVGIFEEVLLRGFCFCLLYKAWQHRKNGLLEAAIAQAVIFGLLHLINLANNPALDTISQVIYATLLGVGFAGLAAYSRSIWPGVIVHSLINLAGSLNDLNPNAGENGGSLIGYLFAIIVISLVSTLPGLWQLRKAPLTLADN